MIASLSMYDWPEERAPSDAFWAAVRDHLRADGFDAPDELTRDRHGPDVWGDPSLLIGQTCGLPYVTGRCGNAVVIARPSYAVPGAGDGLYSSALICRQSEGESITDFRGRRAAINEYGSQSGCHALADAAGADQFFGSVVLSGSHRNSAVMVAAQRADIAALDAVAWALFQQIEPDASARLQVIGWSRQVPALPFITAEKNAQHAPALVAALSAGCKAVQGTGIPVSVVPATGEDYGPIRAMADGLTGRRLAPNARPLPI